MGIDKYKGIIKHYERCLERHGDTHLGVDWPNEEDALKRHQVMLEIISEKKGTKTLLDFGCGLSHFYEFINNKNRCDIIYSGLDLSKKMIKHSRGKHPNVTFYHGDVLKKDFIPSFDYVIMNGVLTEKRDLSQDEMLSYCKKLLKVLFSKVKIGIAFNVMSKNVEWERKDLFHLGLDEITVYIIKELSKNFVIRNDYGLFEYTTYIYK